MLLEFEILARIFAKLMHKLHPCTLHSAQ